MEADDSGAGEIKHRVLACCCLEDIDVNQLWLAVLSSSVLSGIVGAVVGGIFSLRGKRNEYVNDYYKTIIRRRVVAYEKVELLIVNLKAAVVAPDDTRPYHLLFASEKDDDWKRALLLVFEALNEGLWLTQEMFNKVRDLSHILFQFEKPDSVIEYGRRLYKDLETQRDELERLLAKDMLQLHDVPRFLKQKNRPDPGFHPVQLGNR